jgi:hypothetical protein
MPTASPRRRGVRIITSECAFARRSPRRWEHLWLSPPIRLGRPRHEDLHPALTLFHPGSATRRAEAERISKPLAYSARNVGWRHAVNGRTGARTRSSRPGRTLRSGQSSRSRNPSAAQGHRPSYSAVSHTSRKVAIEPVFTAFPVCALINFGVVEPGTRTVAMTRPAGREAQPRRVWRTACACDCAVPRRRGAAPRDCASSIANRCLLKYVLIGGDGPSRSPLDSR